MSDWKWEINLDTLIGKRFLVETTDGMYREGVLTKVEWSEFELDEVVVRLPKVFRLEDDPGNEFDVDRIKSMERVVE